MENRKHCIIRILKKTGAGWEQTTLDKLHIGDIYTECDAMGRPSSMPRKAKSEPLYNPGNYNCWYIHSDHCDDTSCKLSGG